jgi:undecaprenyl-diphosphatase
MNILHAIILGIVEGITEFLPISSTGHLILAAHVLNIPSSEFLKTFEIAIQLGAICAVILLYWRRLITDFSLIKRLIVAFMPTVVIGLAAYPFVKSVLLDSEHTVLLALFFGGVALFAFEKWHHGRAGNTTLGNMNYKQALGIGLAQSVAIIPGISRAAATILGGLLAGLDRKSIVEFSFLLAIPTMIAATVLDLSGSGSSYTSQEYGLLAVGFVVAFITAVVAVKWLLKYIQSHNFISFGIYRVVLAVLFWLLLL